MKKTIVAGRIRREVDPELDDGREKLLDPELCYVEVGDFMKTMLVYDDGDIEDERILKHFGTSFGLLYKLLKHVTWGNCRFYPIGIVKKELCSFFDIGAQSFEGHLRVYRQLNLIKMIDTSSTYMVNPTKFYMGDYHQHVACCKAYYCSTDIGKLEKLPPIVKAKKKRKKGGDND